MSRAIGDPFALPPRGSAREGWRRGLTDVHVDEVLPVLVDWPPHVRLALLVLVAPLLTARAGAGGGLLLGAAVTSRHHGLVRAFAA